MTKKEKKLTHENPELVWPDGTPKLVWPDGTPKYVSDIKLITSINRID